LSPRLKVIFVLQTDPWNFPKSQISPLSSTSSLPPRFLSDRPRSSAATAAQGQPGHLQLDVPLPRVAPELPPLFYPSRCASIALPRSPRSTRRPPPWPGQNKAPEPYLLRAPALQEAPQPVPLTLSPLPQPQTPERRRRPPYAGEHRLTVDPPLHNPSARAGPSISSTSTSRNSPTPPPRPEPVGATSPPTACSRHAAAIAHPDLDTGHLQVRTGAVNLPHPSTLAAGDPSRRICPVNHRPPSDPARDLGLKETKPQGVI